MDLLKTPEGQNELAKALRKMSAALQILDDVDAPGDVASHLDLAICRLEKHLGLDAPGTIGAQALLSTLTEELVAGAGMNERACPWESNQFDAVSGSDRLQSGAGRVDDRR